MKTEAIKATVRNGKVETAQPLDFPDGTELLLVPARESVLEAERDWDDSPEGIKSWLAWLDSLEPLIITPDEQAAWDKDRAERKAWELSQFNERSEKLRRLFE